MRLRDLEGFKDQGSLDALRGDWHVILPDPDNDLRDLTTAENRAHIERLKDSLSIFGWRQGEVMQVRTVETGGQTIVYAWDGRCRLVALTELEAEGRPFPSKVTVISEQRGTERRKRMLAMLSSGTDRKNLSEIEFARGLSRAIEFGYTEQEVCEEMGWKSIGTLHNHLDLLTLKPELRQMVLDGKISRTEALKMQRMTPDADPGEIMRAAEEEHKRLNKKGTPKIRPRHVKAATKPKAPKADKLPVPARAQRQGEIASEPTKPQPAPATKPQANHLDIEDCDGDLAEIEGIAAARSQPVPLPSALAATSNTDAPSTDDFRDLAEALALTVENLPENRTFRRQILSDLIGALKPFADLCNDLDANAKADDDIVEVLFADIKKAWSVYTSATGGQEEAAA